MLARRKPTKTFPYGLGRVDLAGIIIVLIILVSAMWRAVRPSIACSTRRQLATSAGWPPPASSAFSATRRWRCSAFARGREINSAALIADGYHARTDGLTSLAVVAGALGVWLSFPLAAPIVGLFITIAIYRLNWDDNDQPMPRLPYASLAVDTARVALYPMQTFGLVGCPCPGHWPLRSYILGALQWWPLQSPRCFRRDGIVSAILSALWRSTNGCRAHVALALPRFRTW
jgi:hypothetical protein